jgi:hypothetical protein
MPGVVRVEWPTSPALVRRIAAARLVVKSDSRAMRDLRADLMTISGVGYLNMMLDNKDRYGRVRAPLAKSTEDKIRRGKRGRGPSLIPSVFTSRYLILYKQRWVVREGRSELLAYYDGFVSPRGFPIPLAHEAGVPRRNLPKRAVMGRTPRTWVEIRGRFDAFAAKVFNQEMVPA